MTTLPGRPRGEQPAPEAPVVPPMPDVTPEMPEQPNPELPPMAAARWRVVC